MKTRTGDQPKKPGRSLIPRPERKGKRGPFEEGAEVARLTTAAVAPKVIEPQPGPQTAFLATSADLAIYGGAAGAGKTFALFLTAIRHLMVRGFGVVIFRRTFSQIVNEGGLWDESENLFPFLGGHPNRSDYYWDFPAGTRVSFAHMQHEKDRISWDGAQIPLILFDQLEHFTWKQFFYLFSRNRTTCGVRPYVRATCNPRKDHWLRTFLAWWIYSKETTEDQSLWGYPIPERSGVIRWFIVRNDIVEWGATVAELVALYPSEEILPKSCTFIPGKIEDNPILLKESPQYLSSLNALPKVDQLRLRRGNWDAVDTKGTFFRREWFERVPAMPTRIVRWIRYWDRASKPEGPDIDPDVDARTAGVLMAIDRDKRIFICHATAFRGTPGTVVRRIRAMATNDGDHVTVGLEQDPAQAGVAEVQSVARELHGFKIRKNRVRENKAARAKPFASQAEMGNVFIVAQEGADQWVDEYLNELENFNPDPKAPGLRDYVDASSGAYYCLTNTLTVGTF